MKKAIIVIVIFSILAVSFTAMMINVSKGNKIEERESLSKNNSTVATNDYNYEKAKIPEPNDDNNNYEKIIIGESKYFENPIDFNSVEVDGKEVKYEGDIFDSESLTWKKRTEKRQLKHSYFQISGLKNKTIEKKANDLIKKDALKIFDAYEGFYGLQMDIYDIKANFSNVVSIDINYKPININLLDGSEITITDYLRSKDSIKDILAQHLNVSLANRINMGSKEFDEDGNMMNYSYDIEDYIYYTPEEKQSYFEIFENNLMKLMKKYDNDDFDFCFDEDYLYLYFPEEGLDLEYKGTYPIECRIPLYKIYENVIIFDRFSSQKDIYEKDISEEKYIGLADFIKTKDNSWYNIMPITDDTGYTFEKNQMIKLEQLRNEMLKNVEIESDKRTISIFEPCMGIVDMRYVSYVLKFNKSATKEEEADIYEMLMKYKDTKYYMWDAELESLSNSLKDKYDDIEFSIEKVYWE